MKTIHEFLMDADRYQFDFGACSCKKGWAQVDTSQDAWYFGTWANPTALAIVAYAEGDLYITKCETAEEFVTQLRGIKKWNDENGHRFLGIDPGLGEELIQAFRTIGLGDLLH